MFAKIKDGAVLQFPYGMNELQAENPYTNYNGAYDVVVIFPTTERATIHGEEVVPVTMLPSPEHDQRTQSVELGQPVLADGEWTVGWVVTDKTQEQIDAIDGQAMAANEAQAKRLLQESDWSELASVRNVAVTPHLVNGAAFDTYRAALRAIVVDPPVTVETWPARPDAVWA